MKAICKGGTFESAKTGAGFVVLQSMKAVLLVARIEDSKKFRLSVADFTARVADGTYVNVNYGR